MIIKMLKADGSGWVFRDGLGKVVTNTTWRIYVKEVDKNGIVDYDIKVDDVVLSMEYVNALEIDTTKLTEKNKFSDGSFRCIVITASVNYPGIEEREILLVANTTVYLLNDQGKTIEAL
jgi:hypothetical protein